MACKNNQNNKKPTKKEIKYTTLFFGDNTVAEVKESNLFSYSENILKYGSLKIENFKNNVFNRASKEAEAAFKGNTDNSDGALCKLEITLQKDTHSNTVDSSKNQELSTFSEESYISQQDTLENVEAKIINAKDADLETSITLAAEAGSVLLAENAKLKQEMFDLTLKNSHLAKLITESEIDEMICQSKLEELERNLEASRMQNSSLAEAIKEIESQLEKEKKLRSDLVQMFEEQDKEKEQTLCKFEKEIKKLKAIIKEINMTNKNELNHTPKTQKNMETQTTNSGSFIQEQSPTLISQIDQLKIRQDQVEDQMKSLQEHMHRRETAEPTQTTRATHSTLVTKRIQVRNINLRSSDKKRKNVFSVSLQMQKHEASHANRKNSPATDLPSKIVNIVQELPLKTRQEHKAQNQHSASLLVTKNEGPSAISGTTSRMETSTHATSEIRTGTTPRRKKTGNPPISAKLLKPGETIEEFFCKNIDEYKKKTMSSTKRQNPTEMDCLSPQEKQKQEQLQEVNSSQQANHSKVTHTITSFLEANSLKKAKEKPANYQIILV